MPASGIDIFHKMLFRRIGALLGKAHCCCHCFFHVMGNGIKLGLCGHFRFHKLSGKTGNGILGLPFGQLFLGTVNAGVALEAKAVSKPSYPLAENSGKNLLKLYLNDVGILSGIFYRNNIRAVMADLNSINLGSVYETVVAQELRAHGYSLYYYDNKKNGEVDYLIDDPDHLSNIPLEVKSGKDYTVHSALDKFLSLPEYHIRRAYVLSNERDVCTRNGVTYIPIYYVSCFENISHVVETL